MTHPIFDKLSLEKALRDALKSVLEKDAPPDPKTKFYSKFKEEVAEHDDDFLTKHDEDMNNTLIFSGLFSAIVAAFIIDVQSELKPDYEALNNTLLELLLNVTAGITPPGQVVSPPRWTGPNPAIRQVQATLYVTLFATLFAAFLATLGKQWLNRYRQTGARGSLEDTCRDRERKMNGIDRWRFDLVMQSAPLMIQGSLALLAAATSRYLWELDRMVSLVVIGFTILGSVVYVVMMAVSVLSPDCPFQTPFSLLIHSIVDMVHPRRPSNHREPDDAVILLGDLTAVTAPINLQQRLLHSSLSPSWRKNYKLDARCISRMLTMSTDVGATHVTMDFVQEIVWDAGIKTVPLRWIYRKLISCFDFTHCHTPVLIPALRDVAYLSAKAFAHIQIQQLCTAQGGGAGTADESWRPDKPHKCLGSAWSRGDHDLESALLMVDRTFKYNVRVTWDGYQLSPAHHLWMSHLFVYRAWYDRARVPDDVLGFVKYSLDPDEPPPNAVIADCLYIINIMLGVDFRMDELTRRDKSHQMDAMVNKIFMNISIRFRESSPLTNADVSELPFRALKLITRLRTTAVATKSYELFKTIMRSVVAQKKKMAAARLALHAAYPPGLKSVPPVGDPEHISDFLQYCADLPPGGGNHTDAIPQIIHTINTTPNDPTQEFRDWYAKNAGELSTRIQQFCSEFSWW